MDIYDFLPTIAKDTKARYISRIVDTGEAYVVGVCGIGGEPVYAPPYQYPYKANVRKASLIDQQWYIKYSDGKPLYENQVIRASKLFARFYDGSEILKLLELSDKTFALLNTERPYPPPHQLNFAVPDFTVTESSPNLVNEIETANCSHDDSYITEANSPIGLELAYGEAANKSNLMFSLIYHWFNQDSQKVYKVQRASDNALVGYIQISSLDDRTPFLSVGTLHGSCGELDESLIFIYAIHAICEHRFYKGVNYICNTADRVRISTVKDCSGIPVYAVDMNSGPKLNIYFLSRLRGM